MFPNKPVLVILCIVGFIAQARAETPLEYIAEGNYAAASIELKKIVGGTPDEALHFAFMDGLIALREGRTKGAIVIFRRILAEDPTFEPARRELTAALARTGQIESAIFHAERLAATTVDERLQNELQSFILAKRSGKPRGIAAYFSIVPSSNANRGSSADTIKVGDLEYDIDESSKANSGIGVAVGVTAWSRWQLSEKWDGTISGSVSGKYYKDPLITDESTVGLRVDFGRTGKRGRVIFAPIMEAKWLDDHLFQKRLGLQVSGLYRINPDTEVRGRITGFRQRHPERDYLDGTHIAANFGASHIFSPSLTVSVSVPMVAERTKRPHLDHNDLGLTISAEKGWKGGLTTHFFISHSSNRYEGNFPTLSEPRQDQVNKVGVSVRHGKFSAFGFAPELSYTFTRSSSNVALFQYDSHDLGLAFSRRF